MFEFLKLFFGRRIVERVVQAPRFMTFLCLAHYKVANVYDVTQFAYLA